MKLEGAEFKAVPGGAILDKYMTPGIFARLEKQMPDLLAAMRKDLEKKKLDREFEVLACADRYALERYAFEYYEDIIPDLRSKVRIRLNYRLVEDISHGHTKRYVISEELAEYLTGDLPAIDDPSRVAGNEVVSAAENLSIQNEQTHAAGDVGHQKSPALFRKEGKIWTMSFDRKTVHVADTLGLGYIAELLRKPRVAIEAAQLAGADIKSTRLAAMPGIPLADEPTIKGGACQRL